MDTLIEAPPRPSKWLFTVEDLQHLAEAGVFGDEHRIELVEGEIYRMAAIGQRHALAVNVLNSLLMKRMPERFMLNIQNPVILGPRNLLQPDFALLIRSPTLYKTSLPQPHEVGLVIEVSDTTLRFDLGKKATMYAENRIPELWVVDVNSNTVHVFADPQSDKYKAARKVGLGGDLSPLCAPEMVIQTNEFLEVS